MTSQNCEFTRGIDTGDDHLCEPCLLAELRWHCDGAYLIDCSDGLWTARFHADEAVICARSAQELRARIWDDYFNPKLAAGGPGERALRQRRRDGMI